jgi:hypothetical protein
MALRDVGVRAVVEGADGYVRDMDKLGKADATTENGLKNIAKTAKVSGLALTAFAGAAGLIGFKLVQAASDVEEMQSKFNIVFGSLADEAEQWAAETAAATNRSKYELQGFLATLQDTFVPMGFARDRAFELSRELTALAVDVASFNNAADADVLRDFQSALVGNTETVRKYGIVITEARIEQHLMGQGLITNKNQITEQMKIQARLNLILEGTKDAQGDAARTSESFANQMKGLSAAANELQVQLGQELLPIAAQLVGFLTDLIGGFNGLSPELRRTIVILGAVAAGFAAVAGPGLLILGFLPNMIAGIHALRAATALLAVGPAAPIVLLATGLALLASVAIPMFISRSREAGQEANKLGDALGNASESMEVLSANDIDRRLQRVQTRMQEIRQELEGQITIIDPLGDGWETTTISMEEYNKRLAEQGEITRDWGHSTVALESELAALREQEAELVEQGKLYANTVGEIVTAEDARTRAMREQNEEWKQQAWEEQVQQLDALKEGVARARESFEDLGREMDPLNQRFADLDVSADEVLDALARISGKTRAELINDLQVAQVSVQDLMRDFARFGGPQAEAVVEFFEREETAADAANEALDRQNERLKSNADLIDEARESWNNYQREQDPLRRKLEELNVTTDELLAQYAELTGQTVPDLIAGFRRTGVGVEDLMEQFALMAGPEVGEKVIAFFENLRQTQDKAANSARALAAAQAATRGEAAGEFGAGGSGRIPPDADFVEGAFAGLLSDITRGGRPVPDWLDLNFFLDSVLSFFKQGQSRGEALLSSLNQFQKSGVVPRQYGGPGGLHGLAVVGETGPELVSIPPGGMVSNVNRNNTFNVNAQYTSPQEPQSIGEDLRAILAASGI